MTPEQATGFGGAVETPGKFNRKRVMVILAALVATVIGGGLLTSTAKPPKKTAQAENVVTAAVAPSSFLVSLLDHAVNSRDALPQEAPVPVLEEDADEPEPEPEPALVPAAFTRLPEVEVVRSYPPPPQYSPPGPPPAPARQEQNMAPVYSSSLVPPVQGNLFAANRLPPQAASSHAPGANAGTDYFQNALAAQARNAYGGQASDYSSQNDQAGKQNFFNSSGSGGIAASGRPLGENSVWPGTIVPGVLETAINTDLPGNVLARVTRNIYDSQTGRRLLIPQGSVLIAKYNSSVSYAQRRVQIVWDTLIRPDGIQIDLDGMNSVDRSGTSGQEAVYHENWFEYLKAAGIITMYSLANASMAQTAARYADNATGSAVASANSTLVNQLGGNIASRAMNVQPTLTVSGGTQINIMLNKTFYLPPVESVPSARKYVLE